MRRLLVPLVTVTVAAAPSPAIASPRDLTATHTAILAGYALARAGVATIRVAQSRIESFNHKLAVECPGVGKGDAGERSLTADELRGRGSAVVDRLRLGRFDYMARRVKRKSLARA